MKPRIIVEQKITAFANKYHIYQTNPDGTKGAILAFAQQKRFNIKEKVMFYTDESKQNLAFTFRAEKVLDIHGRYFVEDANGQMIGMFRKLFAESLLKSTWRVMTPDGVERYQIAETNTVLAVLRRFGGDAINFITMFIKYHFSVIDLVTSAEVGKYQKLTLFRDHYRFELDDAASEAVDWRVWAAMGVGLDMLQSR